LIGSDADPRHLEYVFQVTSRSIYLPGSQESLDKGGNGNTIISIGIYLFAECHRLATRRWKEVMALAIAYRNS
jgi:hypothetical protein